MHIVTGMRKHSSFGMQNALQRLTPPRPSIDILNAQGERGKGLSVKGRSRYMMYDRSTREGHVLISRWKGLPDTALTES